ncbi:ArsR/SmtB family transcription factor [Desulfofustis glycolicus]|uniref:Transcriptional regulator, ArsR family n=1 Tax=Desulfofustis glycolicus DSM 9705 TaxID=1121409 RepID=A0A1M5V0Q6_9BACT|nr:metalloregulator ArsR/SmtB family transcription factor [Desulfofustis glycolicus]MCB2215991.1 metalloregulator ArsR/SmtB family transcription factor [Desulfobulbaceae bacterium]SHH68740.1 transcriptional regulator, ArsR family [Desulfofustis glycolicus DSM 9705]
MGSKETIFLQRPAERQDFVAWADVLKVLAHPSRLMLIEALSGGERCVQDLTDLVGHDMSTVSKHLNLLRESGIVADDKRGKQVYYRLRIPYVLHVFYLLEAIRGADRSHAGQPPSTLRPLKGSGK